MRPLALVLAAAALLSCGASERSGAAPPFTGPAPLGAPIEAADLPLEAWTFVPFPDSTCGDGTPAGIGVSRGAGDGGAMDLVVFLAGGGACWDWATCAAGAARTGPFGAADLGAELARYPGAVLSREVLPPALAGATLVYVPYCTGDVHAGDRDATYRDPRGGPALTWHHRGFGNVRSYLARLAATFRSPRRLVVMGSSAGGFGVLATYPLFRWYWPDAEAFLVDDSGPPLRGGEIPAATREAWWAAWGLASTLGTFCPECEGDLSTVLGALAARYPGDRLALLSYLHDPVIEGFFARDGVPMDPVTFGEALRRLSRDVVAPLPGARTFYALPPTVQGAHVMLDAPAGVPGLLPWLEAMLSPAGAGWTSVSPLDVIPAARSSRRAAPRASAGSRGRAARTGRSGSRPPRARARCRGSAGSRP